MEFKFLLLLFRNDDGVAFSKALLVELTCSIDSLDLSFRFLYIVEYIRPGCDRLDMGRQTRDIVERGFQCRALWLPR